jgi:hypothetical protein
VNIPAELRRLRALLLAAIFAAFSAGVAFGAAAAKFIGCGGGL